MVSAQIPGVYRVYIENPSGARKLIKSASAFWWGPGGSSEGVIANTPEKWNILPRSSVVGGPGYKIIVTIEGSAATSDASDGVMNLPVVVNGQLQTIGNSAAAGGIGNNNFSVTLAAADIAYVAANETPYLIYTAKEGVNFSIGGDRVWLSIEDNA